MKNSADLGGCYPPRASALVDNTLLDLQNSSYPTQPHSIIAKYCISERLGNNYNLEKKVHIPPMDNVWENLLRGRVQDWKSRWTSGWLKKKII